MKRLAAAGAIALALLTASACGDDGSDDYTEVCMNQYDQRVPEAQCGGYGRPSVYPFVWVYYPWSYQVPGYYTVIHNYARTPPARGRMTTSPPPASGGTAPKPVRKNTWNQPPKSNGGTGSGTRPKVQDPKAPSAPKPAAPRPATPPRAAPPRATR